MRRDAGIGQSSPYCNCHQAVKLLRITALPAQCDESHAESKHYTLAGSRASSSTMSCMPRASLRPDPTRHAEIGRTAQTRSSASRGRSVANPHPVVGLSSGRHFKATLCDSLCTCTCESAYPRTTARIRIGLNCTGLIMQFGGRYRYARAEQDQPRCEERTCPPRA